VFNECSRLREALAYGYPDHAAPRGGLLINAISLCGWKTHHAPDCTFFSCDDNFDLLVAVGFNDRGNPSEVINLTRPEVTLAFSSYEKL
jgi:hypothetical protein